MFSKAERELHRQAFISCTRCGRTFPVNVKAEGDSITLEPGPVVLDPELGFICSGCRGDPLELAGDEDRPTPEIIREQIIDLLFAERGGMTINEIDDIIGIGHSSAAYYLKGMMKDGRVKREKAPDGKADVYIFIE